MALATASFNASEKFKQTQKIQQIFEIYQGKLIIFEKVSSKKILRKSSASNHDNLITVLYFTWMDAFARSRLSWYATHTMRVHTYKPTTVVCIQQTHDLTKW